MSQKKRVDERRNRVTTRQVDRGDTSAGHAKGPRPPAWLEGEQGRKFYEAIRRSGEARWFTASDWQSAMLLSHAVQQFYNKPSAMMLSSIHSMMSGLGIREGDRRGMNIELSNAKQEEDHEQQEENTAERYRHLMAVEDKVG